MDTKARQIKYFTIEVMIEVQGSKVMRLRMNKS